MKERKLQNEQPRQSSAGRASDIDKALGELLAKICSHEAVDEAMEASWNDICSDTGCHPLDIEHGKGKHLTFSPNHWANQVAKRLFVRALKLRLEMPGEPQRDMTKWPDTLRFDDRDKYIDELEAQIERLRAVPAVSNKDLLNWIENEASRGLSEGDAREALTAIKWKIKDGR